MFQGQIDYETAVPASADAIQDILFEQGLYWASGRAGLVDLVAAMRREVAALMSEAEIVLAQRDARAWMTVH